MKKFLLKILLFSLPFGVYLIMVLLVDPYNYFAFEKDIISTQIKKNNSFRLNNRLWNCLEYRRNPKESIILGDSRSVIFNIDHVNAVSGDSYFNLAAYGSNLLEEIESFWYAAEQTELKRVYWGINFNCWNDFERNNRVEEIRNTIKYPYKYFTSKTTFMAMYYVLYANCFDSDYNVGRPKMSKDEFWNSQLSGTIRRYYIKYEYPDFLFMKVKEVVKYCREKKIQLIFFIPPNHVDLQNKISEFQLGNYNKKFLEDISKLGVVYDFDFENEFTRNKDNFSDPFHVNSDTLMTNVLWGGVDEYVRIYD